MKIVIAPDSFKECMRALEVAKCIEAGIRSVCKEATLVLCPMADGGEGTLENIAFASDVQFIETMVSNSVGKKIKAAYATCQQTALVEMASANGLEQLSLEQRDPMFAHTQGTGELILHGLNNGIRRFVIFAGGSATVDGGMGMAERLGYRFYDVDNQLLQPGGSALAKIAHMDLSQVDVRLRQAKFHVATDVVSPLLGATGAAMMYGPQKGATPEMCLALEGGLRNLQQRLLNNNMLYPMNMPGDGAAGGLAMGIRAFVQGKIVKGAQTVSQLVGLEEKLLGADWVVTGEGRTDAQTDQGKICGFVAEMAKQYGVKSVLLSGQIDQNAGSVRDRFVVSQAVSPKNESVQVAMANASSHVRQTAADVFGRLDCC